MVKSIEKIKTNRITKIVSEKTFSIAKCITGKFHRIVYFRECFIQKEDKTYEKLFWQGIKDKNGMVVFKCVKSTSKVLKKKVLCEHVPCQHMQLK